MRLAELNWMEIEAYLKKENRIMVVIGATEQHGYLSVGTDVKIPLALADAASQQSGVLVAPPINFGCSSYFTTYPGTISLRVTTLINLMEDVVRSLFHEGFKKILIINGHGGNKPAKVSLGEIVNELKEVEISWYDWWEAPSVSSIAKKHELKSYHASWIEAFPFVRSANIPKGEKIPFETSRILNAKEVKNAIGDGVYGGPYKVEDAIMTEIFGTALEDVMNLLEFEKIK